MKVGAKYTLITCVRDRPVGFQLCVRWLRNQEFKDFRWVVVDDGDEPCASDEDLSIVDDRFDFRYVRLPPNDQVCTIVGNMLEGLKHVDTDYFCILEDDDWRGPLYLSKIEESMKATGNKFGFMYGHGQYHVPTRIYRPPFGRGFVNPDDLRGRLYGRSVNFHTFAPSDPGVELMKHCLESSFRWRANAKRQVSKACGWFWDKARKHYGVTLVAEGQMVDVKGIPGRGVTSSHHTPKFPVKENDDQDYTALKRLVGHEDAEVIIKACSPS